MDSSAKVIYLRIPKSGSTTLHRILKKEYKYTSEDRFLFSLNTLEKVRSSYTREEFNEIYRKVLQHFLNMDETERLKIKYVHGHLPYGIHQFVDWKVNYITDSTAKRSFLDNQPPHVRFCSPFYRHIWRFGHRQSSFCSGVITVLREPIDRVISHYYFLMQLEGSYLYEKVVNEGLAYDDYRSMETLLREDTGFFFNNLQTAMLAGIHTPDPLDNEKIVFFVQPTPRDLERAKQNLDKIAVVGLTERMDETLLLMKQALGWAHFPYYENANVTARRPKLSEIPKRTLRVIERYNELDCELYEYARKKFEQSVERDLLPLLASGQPAPAQGRAAGGKTGLDLFLLQNKLDGAKQEISRLRAEMETQANEVKRLQGELQAARRETAGLLEEMDKQKHGFQARLERAGSGEFEKRILEPGKKVYRFVRQWLVEHVSRSGSH